jgi:UDP:flavonoid glycosyltransferase YjiC (YdhE family)
MEKENLKVFVFTIPVSGHLNPLLPLLKELKNNNQNIQYVVYLIEELKQKFDSIGVEFRHLKNFDIEKKVDLKPFNKKKSMETFKVMDVLYKATDENLIQIAKDIDQDKPDFIIADSTCMHLRWVEKYYMKWYEKCQKLTNPADKSKLEFSPSNPFPNIIELSTTLAIHKEIYPNKVEREFIFNITFGVILKMISVLFTHFKFCFKYGFGLVNPISQMTEPFKSTKFIMVALFPEFHPRSHLYDSKLYKFIGSTVNEKANDLYKISKEMSDFLDKFEIKETKINILDNDSHLIYISLGTVWNNNLEIFKSILDAMKLFDYYQKYFENKNLKFENLNIIVSLGEKVYNEFKLEIDAKKYHVPSNILLVKTAPQIEILKRCSLFLTHNGMNSTSESIHFGGKLSFFKGKK